MDHPDGKLEIEILPNQLKRLRVRPTDAGLFISRREVTTSYPDSLIELILDRKGLAYVCDEIARDQDPGHIPLLLHLLSYFERDDFTEKRILDFGCGSGASTMLLCRSFPRSDIIGVELDEESLDTARARAKFHSFPEENLRKSPNGNELPSGIGSFDFVIMNAVYEHLLPEERDVILRKLWLSIRPEGVLFISETPYRYSPIETHTTGLPMINFFPDTWAHALARRFSRRIDPTDSWDTLLRKGIRGGTEFQILKCLETVSDGDPVLLEPSRNGVRDRIDLWSAVSPRSGTLKKIAKYGLKSLRLLTGVTLVPNLCFAIRKKIR